MCYPYDPQKGRDCSLHKRWRECIPLILGCLSLIGIASLARIVERNHWWCADHHELLSLIFFTAVVGFLCVGCIILLCIIQPSRSSTIGPRIVLTLFFMLIGLKVGVRYAHMCKAGYLFIEGLAIFGTPVLVGVIVFVCKGPLQRIIIATCILVVVWILATPYLNWIHGS